MKLKKCLVGLTSLVLSAMMLTSCASGGTPASSTASGTSGGTQAADTKADVKEDTSNQLAGGKKITLKMLEHANEATNKAVKELNDAFTAKYPNVTIESQIIGTAEYGQAMKTALAAGDVDIFEFSTFNIETPDWTKGLDTNANVLYIENGDILDLSGQPFLSNWPQNAINDCMSYNGKQWCVPTGTVAVNGIFYNKQIFADNGLNVPKTWDEFMSICQTLQDKGITPMTEGGKDIWPVAMLFNAMLGSFEDSQAFAKALWTGERKFNDQKTLEQFKRMEQFASYFEQGVMSVEYSSVIGRFIAGKAAMLPDGSWDSANIELADPEFDYGFFTMPSLDGKHVPMAGKYDVCYAGYGKSANAEAILAWMDFYSQKENYQKFITAIGFIPVMDGVNVDTKFMKEAKDYIKDFGLTFEIYQRMPKGVGKYSGFKLTELAILGGDVQSVESLADLAQKDFDDALKAAQ